MRCSVRKATVDDLAEIQELNRLLFKKEKEEFDDLLDMDWTSGKEGTDYFRKRLTSADACGFIATIDGKTAGYLVGGLTMFEKYRKMPGKVAELENMFIHREHRRSGVGTRLWEEFLAWCKSKDVKMIRVCASAENIPAVSFYKRCGLKDYATILEMEL